MKRPLVLAGLLALLVVGAPHASGASGKPWLWQCTQIHNAEAQYHCYVRLLRNAIEASGNPAAELPRIDRRVEKLGGTVEASCHVLMHEVGRDYGRAHHVTLATLQRYVPRSNNPNCSAGFGMGLVMYLGPQIIRSGGASAAQACARLPTRYRAYTCVHGLGHALMRAYHGRLREAVAACRRLRPVYAPDCAQGAFHDYWISFRGADGTVPLRGASPSPRVVCDGRLGYIRPCWYRYFLEKPLMVPIRTPGELVALCRGLRGLQRFGCVSAAALTVSSNPFDQMRLCAGLRGQDGAACVRGVPDQALAGQPSAQLRLIRACSRMSTGVRAGCYGWLGRTLAVVTNGSFRERGCNALQPSARRACLSGAKEMNAALVTFS
jgi:hypothetical protein